MTKVESVLGCAEVGVCRGRCVQWEVCAVRDVCSGPVGDVCIGRCAKWPSFEVCAVGCVYSEFCGLWAI